VKYMNTNIGEIHDGEAGKYEGGRNYSYNVLTVWQTYNVPIAVDLPITTICEIHNSEVGEYLGCYCMWIDDTKVESECTMILL